MTDVVEVDYQRWGKPRRSDGAGFLALTALPSGLYVVEEGGLPLPMLVTNRSSRGTFVGFAAAMNPGIRRPLPFLQGRRIAPKSLNMILLGDPSLALHPDVKVGWFLGNRRFDLPAILPRLLDHADRLMGAERRLLWGVSAGGTAALRYARDGDTAVAVNPQTMLANFTRGRVQPWTEHGWGLHRRKAGPLLAEIGDLTRRAQHGRVVYVQNESDDHVALHMAPFAAATGMPMAPTDDGSFRVVLGRWGEGHVPPPPPIQAAILREEAARLTATGHRGLIRRVARWFRS